MNSSKIALKNILSLVLTVLLIVVINLFSGLKFVRIDLTSDQLYSLSDKTIHFLENNIEEVISIDVYLEGDFPAEVQKLKNGLKEKLNEFKAYSGNKLKIRYKDPNEDPELKEEFKRQIYEQGLDPSYVKVFKENEEIELDIWPGLIMRQGDKTVPVQLLQGGKFPISQPVIDRFKNQLEYKIIKSMITLTEDKKQTISFLRGHGELNDFETIMVHNELTQFYNVNAVSISQLKNQVLNKAIDHATEKWDSLILSNQTLFIINNDTINLYNNEGELIKGVENYIKKYYNNTFLINCKDDPANSTENLEALTKSDGLIIAKPTKPFNEREKYIIDQYIMNGGKVFWLIDMMEVNEKLLKDTSMIFTEGINTNIDYMLYKYGARINKNIVTDFYCSPTKRKDGIGDIFTWYFYPVLTKNDPNDFTQNVAPVRFRYASSLDFVGNDHVSSTILLETSKKRRKFLHTSVNYKNLFNYNPENFETEEPDSSLSMALLLEGKFNSHYKGREISDEFKQFVTNSNSNFKSESIENSMVVIGDGDFVRNDFVNKDGQILIVDSNNVNLELLQNGAVKPVQLAFEAAYYGTQNFVPIYGNSVFFSNVVDKLMGNEILIPLRSRMKFPRLLDTDEITINRKYWQFINLFIPLIIILIFGIFIWYFRIKKYTVINKKT